MYLDNPLEGKGCLGNRQTLTTITGTNYGVDTLAVSFAREIGTLLSFNTALIANIPIQNRWNHLCVV